MVCEGWYVQEEKVRGVNGEGEGEGEGKGVMCVREEGVHVLIICDYTYVH